MRSVRSVNGVPIRLTRERWEHVVLNHPELEGREDEVLAAVADPHRVVQGYGGALVAQKKVGKRAWLWVYYKEMNRFDGFVITALTARGPLRGQRAWPR